MTDTSFILHKPKNKSFVKNTKLNNSNMDKVCLQCGQNHNYKPTGGSAILEMISFLDRNSSGEI